MKAGTSSQEEYSQICSLVLREARHGLVQIVLSALAIAEVTGGLQRPPTPAERAAIRDLFEQEFLVVRSLDRAVAEEAQDVCWKYRLHPRDAVHVATARTAQCDWMETTDKELLDLPSRFDDFPVKIIVPTGSGTSPLF
jgi:predicted nucleic acid-binding protein